MGFSRLNSTIQTYTLADDEESANIGSVQLLDAFHGLFTGRSRGTAADDVLPEITDLFSSILGSLTGLTRRIDMAPVVVATHFASGPMFYGTHHTGTARNIMSLHSLVAKVLFWSSMPLAGTLSTVETGLGADNLTNALHFIDDGGQATYSLATSTHELVVGKNTIIAYSVLGGLVLLSCVAALLFSLGSSSGMVCTPALTSFPDFDALKYLHFHNVPGVWTNNRVNANHQNLARSFVTLRNKRDEPDASFGQD